MSERSGVARLTRVVKVAPPSVSTGLMPPPRVGDGEHPGGEHAAGRRESLVAGSGPSVPAGAPLAPHVGVARLTPKAAAAEAAAREVAEMPEGDRPARYDLVALRRILGDRIRTAQGGPGRPAGG